MYTVFHSYKDDELVRYALNAIDHPAVQEICSRLNSVSVELDEVSDLSALEEDLEQAELTVSDLRGEIERLEEENSNLEYEIERLIQELKEAHNELA